MGTLTTASSVKSWAKLSQSSGLPPSMQWSIRWSTFCTCNLMSLQLNVFETQSLCNSMSCAGQKESPRTQFQPKHTEATWSVVTAPICETSNLEKLVCTTSPHVTWSECRRNSRVFLESFFTQYILSICKNMCNCVFWEAFNVCLQQMPPDLYFGETYTKTRPSKLCKYLILNFGTFFTRIFWWTIFDGNILVENIRWKNSKYK